jgi:hypothetical protein
MVFNKGILTWNDLDNASLGIRVSKYLPRDPTFTAYVDWSELEVLYYRNDCILTLPSLSLSAQGHLIRFVTGACTLPEIEITTQGHLIRFVTGTCTLPQIEIVCNGHYYNTGNSILTLLEIAIISIGNLQHNTSLALTLPKITLTCKGSNYAGECILTLPLIEISVVGAMFIGKVYLTLPQIHILAINTGLQHFGYGILTLSLIEVNGTAVYYNAGTVSASLLQIVIESYGHYFISGPAILELPLIELDSTGYTAKNGPGILTLPILELDAIGNRVLIVHPIALVLPQLTMTAIGHRILMVHPITLVLPLGFGLYAEGFVFPRGVETDAWLAFKAQIITNADLNAQINTWQFHRNPRILKSADMPYFMAWPDAVKNEEWSALPKDKFTQLIVNIRCKIYENDNSLLNAKAYILDELIKETLESAIQLSQNVTITYMGNTKFVQLSEYIKELQLTIMLKTKRFAAGDRTQTVFRKYDECILTLPHITMNSLGYKTSTLKGLIVLSHLELSSTGTIT